MPDTPAITLHPLQAVFGERLKTKVSLTRYTAARVGGLADAMLLPQSVDELVEMVAHLWELNVPFVVLGGGSNVLVSDGGVRGVVILNQARRVRFNVEVDPPVVWAESGANFGLVARQAGTRGLAGLEWAAGIPGTVGGAVVGNSGAHNGDMAGNLVMAEILHQEAQTKLESSNDTKPETCNERNRSKGFHREKWPVDRLEYGYRTSTIKQSKGSVVVLAALLRLERSTPQVVQGRIDEFVAYRRRTQPPGASMGSMFKNPSGDYAGRLIEAADLKGTRIGKAEISPLHANFFINHGGARAADVWDLIRLARERVAEKFGVNLELEIELIGDW